MKFERKRVQENAQVASTQDLLDRVTAYRRELEPEALEIFERELRRRGIGQLEITAHANRLEGQILTTPEGIALPCSYCERPAITSNWGWHRLWGMLPIFPRFFRYCEAHRPENAIPSGTDQHPPE
jgi:hypothetical protein